MKNVCRTLDIVKKTTTMIQKVFVYYEVSLDIKLWNKPSMLMMMLHNAMTLIFLLCQRSIQFFLQ